MSELFQRVDFPMGDHRQSVALMEWNSWGLIRDMDVRGVFTRFPLRFIAMRAGVSFHDE